MSMLGTLLFPVGVFFALVGVVLLTNSPFMKEIFDKVDFLQKKRRVLGAVMAILGLVIMALSLGA